MDAVTEARLRQALPPRPAAPPSPTPPSLDEYYAFIDTDLPPNPDEPVMTRSQRYMLFEFQKVGRVGLAEAIITIAKQFSEDTKGGCAIDEFVEDGKDGGNFYVLKLLSTLPDKVIESLIKCSLPYDYHTSIDIEFKRFIRDEMQPTATPGLHANFPAFGGASKRPGKCLSAKRLRHVLDQADQYFKATSKDDKIVVEIEHFFKTPGQSADASFKRKFGGESARAPRIFSEWQDRMNELYINGLPQADENKPFIHCAVECGWGNDMKERGSAHPSNKGTNYLLGVFNALTRKEGYGEMMQLSLFPIWKRDRLLAKIAEITGSILCSTLWTEGGLNGAFPGNIPEPNASDFSFRRNSEILVRRWKEYKSSYHGEEILEKVVRLKGAREREQQAKANYEKAEADYQKLASAAVKQLWIREEIAKIERATKELLLERGKAIDASRPVGVSAPDATYDAFEANMQAVNARKAEKLRQRELRDKKS